MSIRYAGKMGRMQVAGARYPLRPEIERIDQALAESFTTEPEMAKTAYEKLATYGIKVSGNFDEDREVLFTYAGKTVVCTTKEQIDDFVAFVEALMDNWA